MRYSLPNSRIMVHQPSGGFQGQATDIMLHAQEILNMKKRLNEIYVKHTGQAYKAIEESLERDRFLTADMASDFGIVDKVIDKRAEEPASQDLVIRRLRIRLLAWRAGSGGVDAIPSRSRPAIAPRHQKSSVFGHGWPGRGVAIAQRWPEFGPGGSRC